MISHAHLAMGAACPHCHTPTPLARNTEGQDVQPSPGDMSMCIECGRWSRFDDAMQLVKPTPEQMADLGREIDLARWHMAWVMSRTMPQATRRRAA